MKAQYAPDEVREPRFEVDQVTFTLDNLNIGDIYSVGMGNSHSSPINYIETDERFMCEVTLSNRPEKIQFIYNNPLSRMGDVEGGRAGWMTRFRTAVGGVVITCSRL